MLSVFLSRTPQPLPAARLLRPAAATFIAILTLAVAACQDEGDLTAPSPQWSETTAESLPEGAVSETLLLSPVFSDGKKRRLAEEGRVEGEIFGLRFTQRFSAEERVFTMEVQVENRSPEIVWRPIRVRATGLRPQAALFDGADDGGRREGALWDFGQVLGTGGGIEPEGASGPRTIQVRVPAEDEASLYALEITLVVQATSEPAHLPTLARSPTEEEVDKGFVAGVLFVRYTQQDLSDEDLLELNRRLGFIGQEYHAALDAYAAFLEDDSFDATEAAMDRIQSDPVVVNVGRRLVMTDFGYSAPTVGEGSEIVGHHLTGAFFPKAWSQDLGEGRMPGEGVVIAVLDSGIDLDPEADFDHDRVEAVDVRLPRTNWRDRFFGGWEPDPQDENGHGTRVASVATADRNERDLVGGAYGATLLSVKHEYTIDEYTRALWYMRNEARDVVGVGPIIVNMSWGAFEDVRNQAEQWMVDAGELLLEDLSQDGMLLVAAAGNCDFQEVAWPANSDLVMAVGGTDRTGTTRYASTNLHQTSQCDFTEHRRFGSSYGPEIEVVAPMERVPALNLVGAGDRVSEGSGTSLAAPLVAAVAAVLWSRDPQLSPGELRALIREEYTVAIDDPDFASASGRVVAHLEDPSPVVPEITSVEPNPIIGSDQPQPFTILGTEFAEGANVTLRDLTNNDTFPDREATSFTSTEIVLNPVFTTSPAGWSVEVINPDGQSSGQFEFQVVAPAEPVVCQGDRVVFDQDDLAAFAADGCAEVDGNVTIGGQDSPLTNLAGMETLRVVTGDLVLQASPNLAEISQLAGIEAIGASLRILGQQALAQIPRFDDLGTIGGALRITGNPAVIEVGGAPALATIGEHLLINANSALLEVTGFSGLESVGGPVTIRSNQDLESVAPFPALETVGGTVEITNNNTLLSTPEFPALQSTQALTSVSVSGNERLLRIPEFPSLRSGGVQISLNPNLESIGGFPLLEVGGIGIVDNSALTSVPGFPLLRTGRSFSIRGNPNLESLGGFPALEQVGDATRGNFVIISNPALTEIPEFTALESVGGSFEIRQNPSLVVLPEFPNLRSTGRAVAGPTGMQIRSNESLRSIGGFPMLERAFHFLVWNNASLTAIPELPRYETGTVSIASNPVLASIAGFPAMRAGGINIQDNDILTEIPTFPSLEQTTSSGNAVSIAGNPDLNSIGGFPILHTVGGRLYIADNPDLESLGDFSALTSVRELLVTGNRLLTGLGELSALEIVRWDIEIAGNEALRDLDGLAGVTSTIRDLLISGNQDLASISGLENVGSATGASPAIEGDFTVTDNLTLPQSDAEELADALGVGGTITISGNNEN